MSKPNELQDDVPKSDFTTIPLCGIDNAESTTTLFEDDTMTTTTTESLMEHAFKVSDKVASKDDASIFGGESDDVPSSSFIHDDSDDMVEHGIFPLTTTVFGDDLRDFSHHIESESDLTTIPIHDALPQFPCEESHNPHHLSETSDSTICPINYYAPMLDYFILPLDKTMAMVEYDAPPHGSITMNMTTSWISCENSIGHIMYDNPLDLPYAMHEITPYCIFAISS
ncbi:Tyrosyl-tRNA synthetase [Hordeum vulgare]|nr:Tyrosyl-tRNA synthetase [Hordeum vulgare]